MYLESVTDQSAASNTAIVGVILMTVVYVCMILLSAIVATAGLKERSSTNLSVINFVLDVLHADGVWRRIVVIGLIVLWPIYIAITLVVGVVVAIVSIPDGVRKLMAAIDDK